MPHALPNATIIDRTGRNPFASGFAIITGHHPHQSLTQRHPIPLLRRPLPAPPSFAGAAHRDHMLQPQVAIFTCPETLRLRDGAPVRVLACREIDRQLPTARHENRAGHALFGTMHSVN